MTQSLFWVAVFVLMLALLPFGIRWVQSRASGGSGTSDAGSRVLSAVAVGPQQRVVTVEIGSSDARICLVLGVTQQSITCLHSFSAGIARPASGIAGPAAHPLPGEMNP